MDAATVVQQIRLLSGITRKELAGLAGLAPSTVGRIERREMDPTWGAMQKILGATGYRISGDRVDSAGDTTAVLAAESVMEKVFSAYLRKVKGTDSSSRTSADIATGKFGAHRASDEISVQPWIDRWARAGWISDQPRVDDVLAIAISAGNAGAISERSVVRKTVSVGSGWQDLAARLDALGTTYAVSGLVASWPDRLEPRSGSSLIYVKDPIEIATRLGLGDVGVGTGVTLVEAEHDVLERVEIEGGIRFVPRPRALLDAFAGHGRDPDKAEAALRVMLEDAA